MYIFVNQQMTLNSYRTSQAYYKEQIEEQKKYNEDLEKTKTNINSEEYLISSPKPVVFLLRFPLVELKLRVIG